MRPLVFFDGCSNHPGNHVNRLTVVCLGHHWKNQAAPVVGVMWQEQTREQVLSMKTERNGPLLESPATKPSELTPRSPLWLWLFLFPPHSCVQWYNYKNFPLPFPSTFTPISWFIPIACLPTLQVSKKKSLPQDFSILWSPEGRKTHPVMPLHFFWSPFFGYTS